MAHRSTLAAVSAAQLAAQLAGHVVAVRRGRHFDVPFMTGSREHITRDWLWFGTAYSAPPYLLAPQLWATARLLRGPDDRARWVLRWLGTGLMSGYLCERSSRARIRPGGFDPIETPIVVVGWGGVIAMAVLGRRAGRARERGREPRTGLLAAGRVGPRRDAGARPEHRPAGMAVLGHRAQAGR